MRKSSVIAIFFIAILSVWAYWHFFMVPQVQYPPGMSTIDKAALKAERIQAKELREVIEALEKNDHAKIIYGDRFMRWTVLAYTLWQIDQGNLTIIKTMEDLMISYYNHAWYPYVRNKPTMPFNSLIQYFRADGTWEDYWNDYKPVYVAAFMLEYYVLTCYDHEWGVENYQILKNVADSLLQMWLPDRHQPCAYVDAAGKPGGVQMAEVKNLTASVDSAFEYAALISSAQIAKMLMNDAQSYEKYMAYANDLITHFYSQKWEWFSTNIFGANAEETYGTALQMGMTLPCIDAEDKINLYKDYLIKNLRASENSWLLKWTKSDTSPSSRAVFAVIGLAPKYPEIAYNILNAYAEAALANDPWLLTDTDGYEGKDPIWVSGKYLLAYVYLKNRMTLGRIPYSPELVRGNLTFESSFPSGSAGLRLVNSTFPTLIGIMRLKINLTDYGMKCLIAGAPHQNVTIKFHTSFTPSISCSTSRWSYIYDRGMEATLIWFIPEGDVEITLRRFS